MVLKELKFKGVFEIQLNAIIDTRGFFMRTYDSKTLELHHLNREWVQENHSKTTRKGTIRGLHFQFPPFSEAKLVRCLRGSILNVFIDLRKNSETFGQWDAIELNESNNKLVFIPKGFANGFCILSDDSEILYKSDNIYNPEFEGTIMWNDPDVNIEWPFSDPILSEKDKSNMSFKEFVQKYKYVDP